MKKTMMFAVMILAAIILMVSFDIKLWPTHSVTPAAEIGPDMLYVCPAATSPWDGIANGLAQFKRPVIIGFLFAFMLLIVVWAWAMYQSLLKDKFNRDTFKKPWSYTKMLFWAIMIVYILMMTPNYFRTVHVSGSTSNWVMCDGTMPGAKAVRASMVEPKKQIKL